MDEDLDLIADLGADVYRFSTSWARVLPEGSGHVNEEGLDFYDRLVDGLVARGIKPAVTLYHWELPSALSDAGGWRNRDIAERFADFTDILMRRIGDRIWSAAPINEPWCVAWLSHFMGEHAPGLRDIRAAARAMHHVLLAHGRCIETMRGLGMSNLGAVCNFEWADPATDSPADQAAAARYDAIYNRFFLGGIFKGAYPQLVLDGIEPHLPTNWQDDFPTITQPVDWCGINYYTRKLIGENDQPWPSLEEVEGPLPKTAMDWEIFPQGIGNFLRRTANEFTGDLPIYVTESGAASYDTIVDGQISDDLRQTYIDAHLAEVQSAIKDGVPVNGYFIWSLMDNFEWAVGYDKRFGLVHVDFDSLKRTPKASYHAIKAALSR